MGDDKLLEEIFKEVQSLNSIFTTCQEKAEVNKDCLLLNIVNRFIISKNIIPFLEIKDIINFQVTCKDIYECVNNTVCFVSYYKALNINIAKILLEKQGKRQNFSNLKELTEC